MTDVLTTTAKDIVYGALRAAGIIRPTEDPQAEDLETGVEALNGLVKFFQAQGNHLWKQTEGILFTDVAKEKYLLGPGGDHATTEADFINTTLTVVGVTSDLTLTVASVTGMAGAANLITIDPLLSTQPWTAGNSATIAIASGKLTVTNGAASAGYADYTLNVTPGATYLVDYGFELGTSVSATLSVIDPVDATVYDSNTELATTDGVLEFTATEDTATFRIANTSTTIGEDSHLTKLELRNKADGDKVGVKLDDGSRHWSNIIRINGLVLSINDALPSDAAIGLSVFTYTTILPRPLRVYNPRSETIGQDNEIPIRKWSRQQYMRQPSKDSQGTIVKLYYSPQLTQGELYVWQTSADTDQVARFTFDAPIVIASDALDAPDFPAEWFLPLKWNVAKEILPEYRVSDSRKKEIKERAKETLAEALDFDEEDCSVYVGPDREGF